MAQAALRSFDIFDTLVARRCVQPRDIFSAVEATAGHPGFADMRLRAEAALYNAGEYGLDDIYRSMTASFGLSQAAAARLMTLEMEAEFENLIPIREHVARVRPGDLLISDMYLPLSLITRIVRETCGLHFNPVYLSSHGKSGGRAWQTLAGVVRITEHTGDNAQSDIAMCERFGIKGVHTAVAQMTPGETLAEDLGYRGLATAMRTARLALWSADPARLMLGRAQIEVNFPLLFLTCLWLIDLSARKRWGHLLFSSRDAFLLSLLFEKIVTRLGLEIRSTYFFTSRVARAAPSASYLNYFHHLCTGTRTAVIDMCGTGWSLTRLFEAGGMHDSEMFLMHYMDDPQTMRGYRAIADIGREPTVNFATREGSNVTLEALNATDHPMVIDVIQADRVYIPVFADLAIAPRYVELVCASNDAFKLALAATDAISRNEMFYWLSAIKTQHIQKIYRQMNGLGRLAGDISDQQCSENGPVAAMLRSRVSAA